MWNQREHQRDITTVYGGWAMTNNQKEGKKRESRQLGEQAAEVTNALDRVLGKGNQG